MAHNKTELRTRVNLLPIFEKRDVHVLNSSDGSDLGTTKQTQSAICKTDETDAIAYVHPNYKLVQFHTIFNPLLDSIEGEVEGYCMNHRGFAALKVFPKRDELKNQEGEFGLLAVNSVDLSSSITIKFVVRHTGGLYFTIPPKVAGLKKQHTGKVETAIENYLEVVGKVKEAWHSIVENFPKYKIYIDLEKSKEDELALEFGTILQKLNIGTRLSKKLKKDYEAYELEGKRYTLWDVFIKIITELSEVKYKTDAHRERRLDTVCNTIFQYSMALSI